MSSPRGSMLAPSLLVVALLVGACGGSNAPASPLASPPPTVAPTPAVSAPASPSSTPAPTPAPTPTAFRSAIYGYEVMLPPGWPVTPATQPWDGEARIDSNGPYTDQVVVPGSILFFVYGAATDLGLDAYAARTQEQMAAWHECPATPDEVATLTLDGTEGRVHRMTCLGLLVQKLMVVRDGEGLVVNMLAPPTMAQEATDLFEELVAGMRWPG